MTFEKDHFGANACCEQIALHRALLEARLKAIRGDEQLVQQLPHVKRELDQIELMATVAIRLREASSHLKPASKTNKDTLADIVVATPRRKHIKNPPPFPFDFNRYRYKLVKNVS